MYNINRRKFLSLFGCGCCSLVLPSCSSVPITDRKQLTIIPESKINIQAAAAYEQFRTKSKLITDGPQLKEVIEIGKKIEVAVSDDNTDQVIDAISQVSNTGKIGDGKIFVSSLDQVVRIRTGELNEDAL